MFTNNLTVKSIKNGDFKKKETVAKVKVKLHVSNYQVWQVLFYNDLYNIICHPTNSSVS